MIHITIYIIVFPAKTNFSSLAFNQTDLNVHYKDIVLNWKTFYNPLVFLVRHCAVHHHHTADNHLPMAWYWIGLDFFTIPRFMPSHNKQGEYNLVHFLLYDIFVRYFGMISRWFGMKLLFTFLTEKKTLFWTNKKFRFIPKWRPKYRTRGHEQVYI